MDDTKWMKRTFELAGRGNGHTSPNPLVGTVIVKDGRIIGEGFHERYGARHAEIMAIESATEPVAGATLYCNLEPCTADIPNKRTPPCTERIILENLGRVVLASPDPNPYVNGKGILTLKQHGIRVDVGILKEEASFLNERYMLFMKTGRPFIHLKIAQSLDGRIATHQGQSKWITNKNALKKVHQLRSEYDSVLVGIKTVIKDDPSLTVRHISGQNPYRIILDNNLIIPDSASVISDGEHDRTIIFTTVDQNHPRVKQLQRKGIRLFQVEKDESEYVNLEEVISHLADLKITSVLVEGGGEVFTSFIKTRLFDKITFFIAPMMIGTGIQSIGDLNIHSLEEATRLQRVRIEIIDNQAIVAGYRNYEMITG